MAIAIVIEPKIKMHTLMYVSVYDVIEKYELSNLSTDHGKNERKWLSHVEEWKVHIFYGKIVKHEFERENTW